MKIRRVVTTIDGNGKSVVSSDGFTPGYDALTHTPQFELNRLWMTSAPTTITKDVKDPVPQLKTLIAAPGEALFLIVTFPPDSVMMSPNFNPAAAGEEYLAKIPGIAHTFEMENPGMHRTPTIDYAVVLDGEVWLELDDGVVVHLKEHDTIVQNGTRHAWRNRGDKPTTLAFTMMGAKTA